MKRWNHWSSLLFGVVLISAQVGAEEAALATEATPSGEARQVVLDLTGQSLQLLKNAKDTLRSQPEPVYRRLDGILDARFDFQRMAKIVLHEDWDKGNAEQQERFLKEFRSLVVRSYAAALADYSEDEPQLAGAQNEPEGRRGMVRVLLRKPNSSLGIPVDYEVYQSDGNWRVFNVTVDGISLVLNCRNSFTKDLRDNGFEALLEKLEARSKRENQPHNAAFN